MKVTTFSHKSYSPHGSRFRGPEYQTLPKSPSLQTMVQLMPSGTCGGAGPLWLPVHYIRSRCGYCCVDGCPLGLLESLFFIFKVYLLLLVVLLIIRASMQTGTDFRPLDVANCRGSNFGAHPLQSRLPPACLHVCMHGFCICVECFNAWQEGPGALPFSLKSVAYY